MIFHSTNQSFSFRAGKLPVLVSFPHSSTNIPENLQPNYSEAGAQTPDTDWDLPKLYQIESSENPFADVSLIHANFSRFVIDANRPTDGTNLYPGKPTPELCPTTCFDGSPVYRSGQEPDQKEIAERIEKFWQPYHDKIRQELQRMKSEFGVAVLFDAHSILSKVPRLFDGVLPNFNMGTAAGQAASSSLEQEIKEVLVGEEKYSSVFNGRFIGGFITRNFGDPDKNIHAVQLELTQSSYMNETTGEFSAEKANRVRPVIFKMIQAIINWTKTH